MKHQIKCLAGLMLILIVALISCKRDEIELLPSYNSPQGENTYEFPKGTVTDIDGNIYNTAIIGNQEWMAENLKVTHYSDGKVLHKIEDDDQWLNIFEFPHAYCYYDNDTTVSHGALYRWPAVVYPELDPEPGSEIQGICPDGWYVPNNHNWMRLLVSLGMTLPEALASGYNGTDQGSQLAGNNSLPDPWKHGTLINNPAFGSSGFEGLPGGYRDWTGVFKDHGEYALWWTTTPIRGQPSLRNTYGLHYSNPKIDHYRHLVSEGLSVRCVRPIEGDTVSDIDGNIYHILDIGDQTWMLENIKTSRYANGSLIQKITEDSLWLELDTTSKAYCFNSDQSPPPDEIYSALYTWAAVVGYDGDTTDMHIQGVCPNGWHIPSDEEWKTLEKECSMPQTEADETGFRGIDYHVGSQLAGRYNTWIDSYLEENSLFGFSGFNVVGAGFRSHNDGEIKSMLMDGILWTATETNNGRAMCRNISSVASQVNRKDFNKANGFSARCVKDE